MDLYRDVAGELTDEDLHTAQILASVTAGYLVNSQARQDASACRYSCGSRAFTIR